MFDELITPFTFAFGIVLAFVITLCAFTVKLDMDAQSYCDDAVHEFVDTSRASGYISAEAYIDMMTKIGNTGNLYDIEIMHRSKATVPYVKEDGTEVAGKYGDSYNAYYKDEILSYIFPDGNADYGNYPLKNGDYLKVTFQLREPTLGAKIMRMFSGKTYKTIKGSYGGYVGSLEENGVK